MSATFMGASVLPRGTYLLDNLPAATFAASVGKRLSSEWKGGAYTLRRDDGSTRPIGFQGESVDGLEVAAFCGSGRGTIATLYDQSGNGRNAADATQATEPVVYEAGSLVRINGTPVAYVQNDEFVFPSLRVAGLCGLAGTGPFTLFALWSSSAGVSVALAFGDIAAQMDCNWIDPPLFSIAGANFNSGSYHRWFWGTPGAPLAAELPFEFVPDTMQPQIMRHRDNETVAQVEQFSRSAVGLDTFSLLPGITPNLVGASTLIFGQNAGTSATFTRFHTVIVWNVALDDASLTRLFAWADQQ